ncbi:MAG: hypothetical protein PV344_01445, partial [Anaplasma sp.]|nr:hypothetical protein [Anaplasma sp.]
WNTFSKMLKPPVVPESLMVRMRKKLVGVFNRLSTLMHRIACAVVRCFSACCSCVRPKHAPEENVTPLTGSSRDSYKCKSAVSAVGATESVITSSEHVHSNDTDVAQSSTKAKAVTGGEKSSADMASEPLVVAVGGASSSHTDLCSAASCLNVSGSNNLENGMQQNPSTCILDTTAHKTGSSDIVGSPKKNNVSQQR